MRVGIVGGGVFGRVAAAALWEKGCKVTIFDDQRKYSGTSASAFLMKPSWFSGMGKEAYEPALELLDRIYGLQKIHFRIGPVKTYAYRVNKDSVMQRDYHPHMSISEEVTSVSTGKVVLFNQQVFNFDAVIVAAGIWSSRFFEIPGLIGKTGVSFEWKSRIKHSFIRPWAPYKQIVVFNVPDGDKVWGGDGSAILQKNWTEQREQECLERVSSAAGLNPDEAEYHTGVRPFVSKSSAPCLLEKRGKNLYLLTGGGKNGTIAAGWAAHKLVKELL